jgi:DNA-binding transcriptional MocR family regulator
VLITSGAQHGLTVVAMALLKPGDVVATDALTYPGMKVLAELLRLELVPVPAEADGRSGLDLRALERLCKQRRVRAVYVQPTVHNPLGWVMGQGHREHLAALAQRHGLLLIEDAAYAFLAENAPLPLAALAPESTVHVSGFSKNVATGLRVGYVAAPQAWVPRIERAIRASTWNTPSVMTALVCGWLEDGTVQALESAKRKDARKRQALVAKALQGLPYLSHPASYFAWLPLPEGARADRVAGELLAQGISVSTAEPFCTAAQVPQAIRLALGSVDLAMLRVALLRVREVVEWGAE